MWCVIWHGTLKSLIKSTIVNEKVRGRTKGFQRRTKREKTYTNWYFPVSRQSCLTAETKIRPITWMCEHTRSWTSCFLLSMFLLCHYLYNGLISMHLQRILDIKLFIFVFLSRMKWAPLFGNFFRTCNHIM